MLMVLFRSETLQVGMVCPRLRPAQVFVMRVAPFRRVLRDLMMVPSAVFGRVGEILVVSVALGKPMKVLAVFVACLLGMKAMEMAALCHLLGMRAVRRRVLVLVMVTSPRVGSLIRRVMVVSVAAGLRRNGTGHDRKNCESTNACKESSCTIGVAV